MTTAQERIWLMIAIQLAVLQNDIAKMSWHSIGMDAAATASV